MSNHTPGPWRTGDAWNTIFGPPNGNPAPEIIAKVQRGNEANARLLAAAPELLAALKWALGNVASPLPSMEGRAEFISQCKTAQAAIAKAEGKGG